MLVLTRRTGELIHIGDNIILKIIRNILKKKTIKRGE